MRLLTDEELQAVLGHARRGYGPRPIYGAVVAIVRELMARRAQAKLFSIPDPDIGGEG